MKQPSISVIIPTYNRQGVILRAIESVLNQSYKNFDLWIIDDCSTDDTKKIVEDYLEKNNFICKINYIKNQENRGVSYSRNVGINNSTSMFVAFLDSDDQWTKNKLQIQVDYYLAHQDIKIIHCEEVWIRNGRRVNQMKKHQKSGGDIFLKCLPLCVIGSSTVMIERQVFSDVGLFKEDFPVCEDYDLWLRISAKYCVGFIEDALINKYGGHQDQLSLKYVAMDYYRILSLNCMLEKDINIEYKMAVVEMIEHKGEILLKGYQKHNNFEHFQEIQQIVSCCRTLL